MKTIPWKWFDHRSDLPKWLTSGLGQIAVEWSMLEREMEELIRLLLDTDIRKGRISTTGMNLRTRMTVVTNFLQSYVYSSKLDPKFLADFEKLRLRISDKIELERNKMIHGLWDKRDGKWHVLRISAARVAPLVQPEIKRLARAVVPQTNPVSHQTLVTITRQIVQASHETLDFHDRLEAALAPLQNKSPVYTRRRPKHLARSTTTP